MRIHFHKWNYFKTNENIWRICDRCYKYQWWMPITRCWSYLAYITLDEKFLAQGDRQDDAAGKDSDGKAEQVKR